MTSSIGFLIPVSAHTWVQLFSLRKYIYWLISRKRGRGGEREKQWFFLFHLLCIHCFILVRALTGDQTCNPGVSSGIHSNQLSYLARTLQSYNICSTILFCFLNPRTRICFYWFLKRETRNFNWLPPVCAPTWDWTHNLGMCPDQGSNL